MRHFYCRSFQLNDHELYKITENLFKIFVFILETEGLLFLIKLNPNLSISNLQAIWDFLKMKQCSISLIFELWNLLKDICFSIIALYFLLELNILSPLFKQMLPELFVLLLSQISLRKLRLEGLTAVIIWSSRPCLYFLDAGILCTCLVFWHFWTFLFQFNLI